MKIMYRILPVKGLAEAASINCNAIQIHHCQVLLRRTKFASRRIETREKNRIIPSLRSDIQILKEKKRDNFFNDLPIFH